MVLKPSELSRDTKDVLIQHYIDRWVLGKGACLTSDLFGKEGWGNYVDTCAGRGPSLETPRTFTCNTGLIDVWVGGPALNGRGWALHW